MLSKKQRLVMMMRKLMMKRTTPLNTSPHRTGLLMRYSASNSSTGWWQLPFSTQLGGGALSGIESDIRL